jgi:hypothetical protein
MLPCNLHKPMWPHAHPFNMFLFSCHLPISQWHVPLQHHHRVEVSTQWVKATFKQYNLLEIFNLYPD